MKPLSLEFVRNSPSKAAESYLDSMKIKMHNIYSSVPLRPISRSLYSTGSKKDAAVMAIIQNKLIAWT